MSLTSQILSSSTISWSDGTTFDGFIVFLTVVPSTFQQSGVNGEVISAIPTFAKSSPLQDAPLWTIIPIRNGEIDGNFKVWKTTNYNPRGCKYTVYLFDASWTQITGVSGFPSGLFTLTNDTYTFTLGAITVPSSDGSATTPQTGDDTLAIGSGSIATPGVFFVSRQTLTSSSTINYAVQNTNSVLFLFLTEDGTGGWIPTFGSEFVGVDASDMNTGAGKTTCFIFVSDGTYWITAGVRTTT